MPFRTLSFCLLAMTALFGILGPAMGLAHASSPESRPKNCISQDIVSGNLTLNICTSSIHYRQGQVVIIQFLLTNTGPESLTMNSITDSVIITDPNGKVVMREAGFECFAGTGNCTLSASTTREITVRWNTSDPLTAANVQGLYKISASLSACPVSGTCLETVASQLILRMTVTNPRDN